MTCSVMHVAQTISSGTRVPFSKIRPTLQVADRRREPRFYRPSHVQAAKGYFVVDVMHHTVSDVIHNQCCQTAML
jgi:hypothetical protein